MSKNYSQIIDELEAAIEDIESKGISIEPLRVAITELKTHNENIKKIEANIDESVDLVRYLMILQGCQSMNTVS
jgi:hypothetical protein|tara:strand:+ start:1114 stop:1335 length:222 start_codon:yes stop_codon:yes gene_type:complete